MEWSEVGRPAGCSGMIPFLGKKKFRDDIGIRLIPDYYNLIASFQTDIKEVGRLRIGKILRKNRWMSDEEKMIYLQFYNEIEFWSFNTVSNEIKWYYIIIDI